MLITLFHGMDSCFDNIESPWGPVVQESSRSKWPGQPWQGRWTMPNQRWNQTMFTWTCENNKQMFGISINRQHLYWQKCLPVLCRCLKPWYSPLLAAVKISPSPEFPLVLRMQHNVEVLLGVTSRSSAKKSATVYFFASWWICQLQPGMVRPGQAS
jgi:hypothetical protein